MSCKTVGDSGVPCLFPFIYRNTTYYQCTSKYVLFLLNQNYICVSFNVDKLKYFHGSRAAPLQSVSIKEIELCNI